LEAFKQWLTQTLNIKFYILVTVLSSRATYPLILIMTSSLSLLFLLVAINHAEGKTFEVKIPKGASESEDAHFKPKTLTIGKGDTVKWVNKDSTLHTVTSGEPSSNTVGTLFDSPYMAAGKSWEHTFKKTGKFDYYCTLHPSITGKIVVSEGSVPDLKGAEKQASVTVDTTPNTNINVSRWTNFTDSENRFSVQYPSHWTVTQAGNRFTNELPLVATDATDANANATSTVQSQLSVNVFKSSNDFNSNGLAKFVFNKFVKQASGNKLVEPISCSKYEIDGLQACSFVYSGDDEEGRRYGILDVVTVDDDGSNHIISYRADPLNFDKEMTTMDHILSSYKLLKNQK
jgi:plastocyanin